jgi:dTDP-4-dehydrorhamnose 3,5-epimerase
MAIHISRTKLDGVVLIDSDVYRDGRGFFVESYHKRRFSEQGLCDEFVQDNHSRSLGRVLRGLHYQDMSAPMGKLVRCTLGRVFDVAVDLRVGSPTFGQWVSAELSADNMRQAFVPPGFAHGFLTLSDVAEIQYKCTNYYTPSAEGIILWDDPDIGVAWPEAHPVLSDRDRHGISLQEYVKRPAFRA